MARLTANLGQRTDKGTLITQRHIEQQAEIDSHLVIVADHTDEVIQQLGERLGRALEAVGIQAEGDAKALCPVDTGRLRNSITHTIDAGDKTAIIGTNVEYAQYVHEGTRGRKGNPFLRNAVNQNMDTYRAIFDKMLQG